MATFRIVTVLDPSGVIRGSNQVQQSLNRIERSANGVGRSLRDAFAFAGIGFGIGEVLRLADAYTALQNRLRVVTSTQQELTAVTEELFRVSQETRAGFQDTVELYSRLALSSRELGVSQQELINFTRTLNQAIIVSGATAREASAGLIQFSQGIASGTLNGEELRAVLEQLPVVADVIARQLGVTRGELRKMGADGLITADIILEAFRNAREEIGARFGLTIPTLSQSFTVLRNSVVRSLGQFDTSIGLTRTLAQAMIGLSINMDVVIRGAGALAIAFGITLAAQAIPAAISGFIALNAVIAANPIGAIIVLFSAIIGVLIAFHDRIIVLQDGLVSVGDLAVAVWDNALQAMRPFITAFQNAFNGIITIIKSFFNNFEFGFRDVVILTAINADTIINTWRAAISTIIILFQQLPNAIAQAFIDATNFAIENVNQFLSRVTGAINLIRDSIGSDPIELIRIQNLDNVRRQGENLGESLAEGLRSSFQNNTVQNFVEDVFGDARINAALRRIETLNQAQGQLSGDGGSATTRAGQRQSGITFEELFRRLQDEGRLLQLNNQEREIQQGLLQLEHRLKRELTDAERDLAEQQLRYNQSLSEQNRIFEEIRGPVEEYENTIIRITELLDQGRISVDEYLLALQNTSLAQGVNQIKQDLFGDQEGFQLQLLQDQLLERQVILQQARDAEYLSEQEFLNLSLEANRAYNNAVLDLETQRYSTQIRIGQSAFGQLANLARGYAGEQSGIYRALFAASKAFAIADATIQVTNAIAKAANSGPFPANLGAIAAVAAATGRLVSTITSTSLNIPAFQNGGSFRVGGSGGTDSQLVQFRASPNETVSVRTPAQERASQQPVQQQQQPLVVQPINVFDPSIVGDFLVSSGGERTFLNVIQSNAGAINNILGDR